MEASDMEAIKDIPGYKVILKTVLKGVIQQMVEQLANDTGEESVILTASVTDGSLSHLGSETGKVFIQDHDDIKSQFLGFCLKRNQRQKEIEKDKQQNLSTAGGRERVGISPRYKPSQKKPRGENSCTVVVHPVTLTRVNPEQTSQDGTITGSVRIEPYPRPRDPPAQTGQLITSPHTGQQLNTSVVPEIIEIEDTGIATSQNKVDDDGNDVIKIEAVDKNSDAELFKMVEDIVKTEIPDSEIRDSEIGNVSQYQKSTRQSSTPNTKHFVSTQGQVNSSDVFKSEDETNIYSNTTVDDIHKSSQNLETDTEMNVIIKTEPGTAGSEMDVDMMGFNQGALPQDSGTWQRIDRSAIGYGTSETSLPMDEQAGTSESHDLMNESLVIGPIDESGKYKCGVCSFSSKRKHSVKRHVSLHLPKLPNIEDFCKINLCDECGAAFKTKVGLELHVRNKHLKVFRFKCTLCPAAFNMRSAFQGHLASHHKKLRVKCSECGVEFRYKQSLKDHKMRAHVHDGAEKKIYSCFECQQDFSCSNTLQEHMRGKHSAKRYECPKCDKIFKWRSSLAYHKSNAGHY